MLRHQHSSDHLNYKPGGIFCFSLSLSPQGRMVTKTFQYLPLDYVSVLPRLFHRCQVPQLEPSSSFQGAEGCSVSPSAVPSPQCCQRAISETRITYTGDLLEPSSTVNEFHVFGNEHNNPIIYILLLSPSYEQSAEARRD